MAFLMQALTSHHSSTSSITTASSTTSTFSAPTPTYTPLSDCPNSNDTGYTSSYARSSSSTNTGLDFTKYCDLAGPLSRSSASRISEAFVYSFSDCIEICAGYNFYNAGSNCTAAVYQPSAARPGNCWVGHVDGVSASSLSTLKGTDVALLKQS